jgi:hypothetical protein
MQLGEGARMGSSHLVERSTSSNNQQHHRHPVCGTGSFFCAPLFFHVYSFSPCSSSVSYNLHSIPQGSEMRIGGIDYQIDLYLSGDWKFLRTVLGLSGPNRHYFCLLCKCNKIQIADGSQTWPTSRSHAESALLRRSSHDSCSSHASDSDSGDGEPAMFAEDVFAGHKNLRQVYDSQFEMSDLRKELGLREIACPRHCRKSVLVGALVEDDEPREQSDTLSNLNRMRRSMYLRKAIHTPHGKSKGYERESLFKSIPFENIIPDVLHCFLRVFDRLFTGLVEDCCRHGEAALNRLQEEINDACAVKKFAFKIGDNEVIKQIDDAGVKAQQKKRVTYGDLDGGQKLRIMRNLKIENVLLVEEGAAVQNRQELWRLFLEIYNSMRRWGWKKADVDPAKTFRAKCTTFFELYVQDPVLTNVNAKAAKGAKELFVTKRTGGYFPEVIPRTVLTTVVTLKSMRVHTFTIVATFSERTPQAAT